MDEPEDNQKLLEDKLWDIEMVNWTVQLKDYNPNILLSNIITKFYTLTSDGIDPAKARKKIEDYYHQPYKGVFKYDRRRERFSGDIKRYSTAAY